MERYQTKINQGYSPLLIGGGVVALVLLVGIVLWPAQKKDGASGELHEIQIPTPSVIQQSDNNLQTLDDLNIEPEQKIDLAVEPLPPTPLVLPELAQSDTLLKHEVEKVSQNLPTWFTGKQMIEKYIVLVNDLSQNQLLYKHRQFLTMPEKMQVGHDAQGLYMKPESYHRYDAFTNAITTINVEEGIKLYLAFKPLFKQVFQHFAYPPEYNLEDIFIKAAANVIEAPVIEGRIALVPHASKYRFADKKLESLADVQKQMLRMGPENTQKIQSKLREMVTSFALLNE